MLECVLTVTCLSLKEFEPVTDFLNLTGRVLGLLVYRGYIENGSVPSYMVLLVWDSFVSP